MKVIAHRGASAYAPENTLAAFALALRMGATAIEFDVQQTKDGRLVVIHDLDLRRVAGTGKSVRNLTFAELRRLDVGGWFGPRFADQRAPALAELLALARSKVPEVELQLEIKNGKRPYADIERRVLDALSSEKGWRRRVVISSFDHAALGRVRALDDAVRLGYLAGTASKTQTLREVKALDCESVHLSLRRVDEAWVDAVHAAGRKVFVYTVNTPEEYRRMKSLGVDGVFSNEPDLVSKREVRT